MENHDLHLETAPQWGLFLGKFGIYGVYATLAACSVALLLSLFAPDKFQVIRRNAFYLSCLGFVLVFITLATLFVTNQFQFEYVFSHSSKENPLSYRIASVWTAQQGSFLLWAVFSALFGWATIGKTKEYERWYTAAYSILLGVLAGILAYETPFGLLTDIVQNGKTLIPPDGTGMVPGLQNYWVVIHPPIIFLGFGSLTVPFAYGVAAMITKNPVDWIKQCRAPVLLGVSILGLGISLGGLWAYETQGWGGFWGWDPVENVSLVPWLFLVVLAHGIIVQNVRSSWVSANLFMSGIPFIAFVYGTFLTRSGLLDKVSVHSFASMDQHALVVLRTFLYALVIGYVGLFAWRGFKLGKDAVKPADTGEGFNRASFYQLGMLSLCLMSVVIALGMSWPVISVAIQGGEGAAVDAGVYHKAVFWFFGFVMVAMAVGPFVSWRRDNLKNIFGRFVTMASLAIGSSGFFLILSKFTAMGVHIEPGATVDGFWKGSTIPLQWCVAILLFFCFFVAYTNLWRSIELAKRSKLGIGPFVAHFGIAMLLGGLIISKSLEQTQTVLVRSNEPKMALGYTIKFKDFNPDRYYDRSNTVKFDVTDPDGRQHVIEPNLYYIPNRNGGMETAQSWPFIERFISHDMYYFLRQPIVEVFKAPMVLKPGEVSEQNDFKVKYINLTRVGEPGKAGVKFGANLEITYTWNEGDPPQTYKVNPTMTMTEDRRLMPSLVDAGDNIKVAIMAMNANDRSVDVQLFVDPPFYPVQVFYKPLTCLVWIGTGIFTIGGFISAFYRRMVRKAPEGDFVANSAKIDSKN